VQSLQDPSELAAGRYSPAAQHATMEARSIAEMPIVQERTLWDYDSISEKFKRSFGWSVSHVDTHAQRFQNCHHGFGVKKSFFGAAINALMTIGK
jgi:hypothetical protein